LFNTNTLTTSGTFQPKPHVPSRAHFNINDHYKNSKHDVSGWVLAYYYNT
jgi:hypothetical protein